MGRFCEDTAVPVDVEAAAGALMGRLRLVMNARVLSHSWTEDNTTYTSLHHSVASDLRATWV